MKQKKPGKVIWIIWDKKGQYCDFDKTKSQAAIISKEYNQAFPEDAPHKPYKYVRAE